MTECVWVVIGHWYHDGSEIIDIFRSKEAAQTFINNNIKLEGRDQGRICPKYVLIGDKYGVWDFIDIEEHNVQ